MDYAKEINAVLKKLEWGYVDLAHEIGVDKSTVSRWISGEFKPSGLGKKALLEFLERNQDERDGQSDPKSICKVCRL